MRQHSANDDSETIADSGIDMTALSVNMTAYSSRENTDFVSPASPLPHEGFAAAPSPTDNNAASDTPAVRRRDSVTL